MNIKQPFHDFLDIFIDQLKSRLRFITYLSLKVIVVLVNAWQIGSSGWVTY